MRIAWCLECDAPDPIQDFVLPDGFTELIVHYRLVPDSEQVYESSEKTVFAGQIRSALSLEFPNGLGMLGVRFRPAGAACFLRDTLGAATDAIVPLESWDPRKKEDLEARVWTARTRDQRVQALWEFLGRTLHFEGYDRQVAQLVDVFNRTKGTGEISALMDRFNIGQRQIERRFKAVVGLSMKEYNRIRRFKEAVRLLHEKPEFSLLDVALECGYYDQSHFNREFKSLTGKNPRQYLTRPSEISNLYLDPGEGSQNVGNLQDGREPGGVAWV